MRFTYDSEHTIFELTDEENPELAAVYKAWFLGAENHTSDLEL